MCLECSFISIYYFDDTKDSKYNSNLIYIFSVTNITQGYLSLQNIYFSAGSMT